MGDPAETFPSSQVPLHARGTSVHWAKMSEKNVSLRDVPPQP